MGNGKGEEMGKVGEDAGGRRMGKVGKAGKIDYRLPITNYQLPITDYQ
jgi:hypothetical protein